MCVEQTNHETFMCLDVTHFTLRLASPPRHFAQNNHQFATSPMRAKARPGAGPDAGFSELGWAARIPAMGTVCKVILLIESSRASGRDLLRGIARYAHFNG